VNNSSFLVTQSYQSDLPSETLCSEFESKWRSSEEPPRIEDYLRDTAGPHRSTLLGRLILIELRYRFLSGETPDLAEYARRFPQEDLKIDSIRPLYQKIRSEIETATAETVVPESVRKTLGKFQLMARVGKGGFGEVWRAWDPELRRLVAIKILFRDKTALEHIDLARHEAKVAAQLIHPNIVRMYAFEDTEDCAYTVSEYIDGLNLRQVLKQSRMNQIEAARICSQIAQALHQAHQCGIVHRDVKPANVMLDPSGNAKLTDFGVAHWASAEQTLRLRKDVVGSANYMSPEQARGSDVSPQSDVYALGVLLYEAVTGKLPFKGPAKQILVAHQYNDPPAPRKVNPAVSRDLETVCLKALEKDPEQRYQTARQFAEDLEAITKGEPVNARPVRWLERKWRAIRRKPYSTMAVVGSVTMGVAGAVLALQASVMHDDGKLAVQFDGTPGATYVVHPIDPKTGLLEALAPDGSTSRRTALYTARADRKCKVRMAPGFYSVVGWHDGNKIEVFRTVPEDATQIPWARRYRRFQYVAEDTIEWPEIMVGSCPFERDFVLIPGYQLEYGNEEDGSKHQRSVGPLWVYTREFSIADFRVIYGMLHPRHKGMKEFDSPQAARYDEAMNWAEFSRARLPTEHEFEYIARLKQMVQQRDFATLESVAASGKISLDELLYRLRKIEGIDDGAAEWVMGSPGAYWVFAGNEPPQQWSPDYRVLKGGISSASETEETSPVSPSHREVLHYGVAPDQTISFRLVKTFSTPTLY